MSQKFVFMFCLFVILLFSVSSFSAETQNDEFSLDETPAINQPAPNSTPSPTANEENPNLASPIEVLQNENALYGFSVGVVLASQPIYEKYTAVSSNDNKDIDRQSEPMQSFGILFRYAVIPFNRIGTDINISYTKSLNHSRLQASKNFQTVTGDEISTIKAELNLSYALEVGDKVPLYFLLGIGAEQVTGQTVELILNKNGAGGQVGAGFVVLSTINLEAVYAYYVHRISNDLYQQNLAGTPARAIDTEKAQVINQGPIFRGTYSFKF